ncbi:NAD(P)/FAD-dependent oxidoreductase [Synechococcus sp. PCC 7336]|uniref:dihydrolipoyl dehydrogenase family protein n=1 Tax=Synechococcus sp. PCC 7336 TaxID=195250 RepID=UPI00034B4E96|nr:FAD-dependent oxidoreductase [Synechococcus sp. PCC 7336]
MAVPYDVVIIGGGSGGLVVASAAAQLHAKVALVEKEQDRLGGDCLYYGCVPSKSLIHAGEVAHSVKTGELVGVNTQPPHIEFARATGHVQNVIKTIAVHDSTERFEGLGVEVIYGSGQFKDRDTFTVNGRDLKARAFVVATGSHPVAPPVPGLKEAGYLTNIEVFSLTQRPSSLVVVGAGPIGCELGQSFSRLGSKVTILASRDVIMPKEDPDLARVVQDRMIYEGIEILTRTRLEKVEVYNGKKIVHAGGHRIETDEILVAAGRKPNVEGLNLEAAGVEVGKGGIVVNERLQTTNPKIYGCGDVIGGYQFTHVAGYEATVVLTNALFFSFLSKAKYSVIPWATFTDPELGRVGLTEAEARQKYGDDVVVVEHQFAEVDRALAEGAGYGFAKVICNPKGKILGAHIVGRSAGELIHEYVMAMTYGLDINKVSGMVHVYPTLSEISAKAALQFKKKSYANNTGLQTFLKKFFAFRRAIA